MDMPTDRKLHSIPTPRGGRCRNRRRDAGWITAVGALAGAGCCSPVAGSLERRRIRSKATVGWLMETTTKGAFSPHSPYGSRVGRSLGGVLPRRFADATIRFGEHRGHVDC